MHSPQRDVAPEPKAPAAAAEKPASQGRRPGYPRDALVRMQRQYGNRLTGGLVQAKLNVGPAGDALEQEADRLAELATGTSVQRAPESAQSQSVQRVGSASGASGGVAGPAVEQSVARARGAGGRPVPGGIRKRMEQVTGADFGGVRMHVNAEADRLNDALGSRACTVGADVFVRRSEYRPGSSRGDALLGHELTHTVQQGAAGPGDGTARASGAGGPTAQRSFGFEFELAVPVFDLDEETEEEIPPETQGQKMLAGGAHVAAHLDHTKALKHGVPRSMLEDDIDGKLTAPILELVTRPMDEMTETEADVRAVMGELTDITATIDAAVKGEYNVLIDTLPHLTANPANTNHVGFPNHVPNVFAAKFSTEAYVQSTIGLPTVRVADEFAYQADADGHDNRLVDREKRALADAGRIADEVVGDVLHADMSLTRRDVHGLSGFLALIAYYLVIGTPDQHRAAHGLSKQQVGIFYYKTRLSTVRNDLVAKNPGLRKVLVDPNTATGPAAYNDLARHLVTRSGRGFHDPLIPDSGVTCAVWLREVLTGKRDRFFENSVSPGSAELEYRNPAADAELPLTSAGVVMENRRFAQSIGKPPKWKAAPAEWPDLAVNLYRHLRQHYEAVVPTAAAPPPIPQSPKQRKKAGKKKKTTDDRSGWFFKNPFSS